MSDSETMLGMNASPPPASGSMKTERNWQNVTIIPFHLRGPVELFPWNYHT